MVFLIYFLALSACTTPAPPLGARLSAVEALQAAPGEGFARALTPRAFTFPADHGPHPDYQIEWWYYTGNLATQDGRHFGFQLTFFRTALTPHPTTRASLWGANTIYMAHFALSDVANTTFAAYERFSRDGAGLAGAQSAPFRVALDNWVAEGSGPADMTMHLHALEGSLALDLTLDSLKPPVLQGDRGLSQKGPTPGNASYYYSLTRMATNGTIQIQDQRFTVTGLSWMDHEWSTSALEAGAVGWDWFSIQLADGRDLMYAQVRNPSGASYGLGTLVALDGTTRTLAANAVTLEVLDTWQSPQSQTRYPARWRLTIPSEELTLELIPVMANQELPVAVVYWEGAVRITGTARGAPIVGNGYVELTGYAK